MSVGNKKRKRTDSSGEPPAKLQVVEKIDEGTKATTDAESRAASRQAKSERRSKKPVKNSSLLSKAGKRSQREAPLLTSKPDLVNGDNLADGEDYVSLSVDANLPPKSKTRKKAAPRIESQKKSKAKAPSSLTTPAASEAEPKSKKDRFILFIGNLPYAATKASITGHFASLQPFTVRHSTDKVTKRSKGFAFLEFENYDKMKTCIKLYHHSMFDPANQPASSTSEEQGEGSDSKRKPSKPSKESQKPTPSKNARRINVELTAGGGGGKSEARKDKIKQKNAKLSEQRERQHEKEAGEKASKPGHGKKSDNPASGVNADEQGGVDDRGNVHPSRLQRVAH